MDFNGLNVVAVNPAGNITLIVKDYIPPEQRTALAKQLLSIKDWNAEQIGFVAQSRSDCAAGRLEMMGGEFCGNAARSFGYMIALEKGFVKGELYVEISGADAPMLVTFDIEAGTAKIKMPIPYGSKRIKSPDFGELPIIMMEGIYHVIIENVSLSEKVINQILKSVYEDMRPEALGMLFVQKEKMTPVVYVAATETLVYENSCGSGSVAYAYYLSRTYINGAYYKVIKQPGGEIETVIEKAMGKVVQCEMGGKISIINRGNNTLRT